MFLQVGPISLELCRKWFFEKMIGLIKILRLNYILMLSCLEQKATSINRNFQGSAFIAVLDSRSVEYDSFHFRMVGEDGGEHSYGLFQEVVPFVHDGVVSLKSSMWHGSALGPLNPGKHAKKAVELMWPPDILHWWGRFLMLRTTLKNNDAIKFYLVQDLCAILTPDPGSRKEEWTWRQDRSTRNTLFQSGRRSLSTGFFRRLRNYVYSPTWRCPGFWKSGGMK